MENATEKKQELHHLHTTWSKDGKEARVVFGVVGKPKHRVAKTVRSDHVVSVFAYRIGS